MSIRTLGILGITIALLAVPLASANHGLSGRIVGQLSDGTAAVAKLTYVGGNGNTQTFRFTWTLSSGAGFTCNGFGSIEVGFVGVGCNFSTSGSGDFHAYPAAQADHHSISISVNGVSGSGEQIICADSGPTGTACNNAFALAPV